MIYVCVPSENAAPTVGLVLWKVRQVFETFPREYQLLVADDASTDATSDVLKPYQQTLPITLIRSERRRGYGATVEALLREAVRLSDRPKRDAAITLPADFGISPEVLPALVRSIESGADLVVGESLDGSPSLAMHAVRRSAPLLLRPGLRVPGLRDFTSGVAAFRLVTLKQALSERPDSERPDAVLETDGLCASAELVARAAVAARQIAVLPVAPVRRRPAATSRREAMSLAWSLFRAGRRLRIPPPSASIRRAV